ncbi:MAG TPA: protein kinase [Polyangium sp.]|nr:protein kinase [Polyangium sp.]
MTHTHVALGSPLYMSPEQMSKTKTVDMRTNIWALGVIAYELLTGTSPFRGATMLEIAANVLQEEPRPLREVRPDVREAVALAITRCLHKKRADRWAKVEEFARVLEEFEPTTSIRPSVDGPTSITFGHTGT